ncbi:MAG: MmcQ/YjbR family DNA-binding protein [Jatrophihabitantaceae bacterium]
MITVDEIRTIALGLPRTYEALVGERIKFKVGRIVYLSISPDETVLGFAFPKEERAALVAAEPAKFHMPVRSDERYNWVRVWLAALDEVELRELIVDAWCMAVPKSVAAQYFLTRAGQPVRPDR